MQITTHSANFILLFVKKEGKYDYKPNQNKVLDTLFRNIELHISTL